MINVIKDDKGDALIAVQIKGVTFTALDVAYTLAQNYKQVLVGDNVYIGSSFPLGCLTLELEDGVKDVPTAMANSNAEFYFDADGVFLFRYENEPNADRAATEFNAMLECGHVIMAPALTKFSLESDAILVKDELGANKTIYTYRNL